MLLSACGKCGNIKQTCLTELRLTPTDWECENKQVGSVHIHSNMRWLEVSQVPQFFCLLNELKHDLLHKLHTQLYADLNIDMFQIQIFKK